jgi:V8-like Glu-specific endopeptidase
MFNLKSNLLLAASWFLAIEFTHAHAQTVPYKITGSSHLSRAVSPGDFSKFVPQQRMLKKLRRVQTPSLEAPADPRASAPVVLPGHEGGPVLPSKAPAPVGDEITSQNYGSRQLLTLNHYSDNLVPPAITSTYPYRTTGWFTFTDHEDNNFRCSAALISRSILLTAGHCVHKGGGGRRFWIKEGTFYPAFANGPSEYGSATAAAFFTTTGWFRVGELDQGYDVALVVLNKRSDTLTEIGTQTGTLSVCLENCLQPFWQNTQLGYPGNYYEGLYLTEGRHIEYSDSRDYRSGSGMEGGSSGGPHIANIGSLQDSSDNKGRYTRRNIVFAVTSWGFTDATIKIQGHSSTSGPNNSNDFKTMYNSACNKARELHGSSSCTLAK